MELAYSRPWQGQGNFGDDLNEWIWEEIAPGLIDDDPSTLVLGIGTIFDRWFTDGLEPNSHKVVLGSGSGLTRNTPVIDCNWTIYGVRGPLTASFFNLSSDLILTDPAMLLHDVVDVPQRVAREGVGFMPHISSIDSWNWNDVCTQAGLIFINPRDEAKKTLGRIANLSHILTEAMHGAIVADALRVPWTAVSISRKFQGLKWYDWGGSLGLPVIIHRLPELHMDNRQVLQRTKTFVKQNIRRSIEDTENATRKQISNWEVHQVVRMLRKLSEPSNGQLSDPIRLEYALKKTRAAVNQLLEDKMAGRFEAPIRGIRVA